MSEARVRGSDDIADNGTASSRAVVSEADALAFARSTIRSVWTLELLLLLARNPQRTWRAEELVKEMRASAAIVSGSLRDLESVGLVQPAADGGYGFQPKSAELAALVAELGRIHAEKPMTVIKEILSAPDARIQTFADAFRFKK